MDKVKTYRTLIKKILTEYHDWVSNSYKEPDESIIVFDEERDHYLWMHVGWNGKKRSNGTQVYVRIKNEKIWIEEDWTEEGIATELMNLGILPEEIVLAFHPPDERSLTNFAVA